MGNLYINNNVCIKCGADITESEKINNLGLCNDCLCMK